MDYYQTMTQKAAEGVTSLAAEARKAEKALAAVDDRIEHARQDVERRKAALDRHRGRSTEKLAKSTSAFQEWQGRLRRLEREKHSAEEALALLTSDVKPQAAAARDAARKALRQALAAAAREVKVETCEPAMAEHFDAAVAEHDGFLAARARLFREHDVSPPSGGAPVARCARLDAKSLHRRLTGAPWLEFTSKPPPKPKPKPDVQQAAATAATAAEAARGRP